METRNISSIPSYTEVPQEQLRDAEIGIWETSDGEGERSTRKVSIKERRAQGEKRKSPSHQAPPPIHYKGKVDKALPLKTLLMLQKETLLKEFPFACDSLQEAKGSPKYIPSTPDLEEPSPAFKGPIEKKVIESLEKIREVNLEQQNLEMDFMIDRADSLLALQKEHLQTLQKNAERLSRVDSWSLLHAMADGIISAVTILAGITLAPTTIGFCMIGLGFASLTNLAFSQLGIWDKIAERLAIDNQEKQNILKLALPGAFTFICMLAGPILLANGMMKLGFSATRDLPVLLETTIALVKGTTSIGAGISTMQIDLSKADLVDIEQKMAENSALSERVMNFLEAWLKELDQNVSKVARILKLSTRMQRKIARIRG